MPNEIYRDRPRMMEAYYMVMQLPEAEREQFVLMIPYVLDEQPDRVAQSWLGAISDPDEYGKMVLYRFPKGRTVYGPMMFEAQVSQDDYISRQFTLWGQQGSEVVRGNTLMIPLAGSLLYVEPVYIISSESPVPEMRQVIISHEDSIVMRPTVGEALQALFGTDPTRSGARPTPTPVVEEAGGDAQPPPMVMPPVGDQQFSPQVAALLGRIIQLDEEAQAALSQGNLGVYQEKQQEQSRLLEQLDALLQAP
jgi:uncharacterized membrane protein (UPF0182 family)